MFFATVYDENTDSALHLLNLLDLLTVERTFLHYVYFNSPTNGIKSSSLAFSITAFVMLVMFTHVTMTRYASKSNFYKARFRTNIGKTTLSALTADHWQKLPH